MKKILLFLAIILALTGCQLPNKEKTIGTKSENASVQLNRQQTEAKMTITSLGDELWLPLPQSLEVLNIPYRWDEETKRLIAGDTDPYFSVQVDQQKASVGREQLSLQSVPKWLNQMPYLSLADFERVTGIGAIWDKENTTIQFNTEQIGSPSILSNTALKDIDQAALIAYAKRFMGVPYDFGAKHYSLSRRFDCSSYTEYVFERFGINLPGTSRLQSQYGKPVSIQDMKAGDLIFMYVPGRYSSNNIVGHVGIYLGDNKFLHTYGAPGVTISSFEKGTTWRNRFLKARRVAL
jgi:hypothetical protein